MSLNRYYRAKTLVRKGLIKITQVTDKSIFFETSYKENKYSIIYNRDEEKWNCTCVGFSAFLKGKDCVHIMAAKMLIS